VQSHELEELDHALTSISSRAESVDLHRLCDARPDGHPRVERCVRVLEDHLEPPPNGSQLPAVERAHFAAVAPAE
jgi:hypothetical protein